MARFLVDEDMPCSTVTALRDAGHEAQNARDMGLRGHSDADVFQAAQAPTSTLITADLGFASTLRYPPGSHAGIIVVRVPDTLATHVLTRVVAACS